MTDFATRMLPDKPDVIAPDGSEVRPMARLDRASMGHFRLVPSRVTKSVPIPFPFTQPLSA